MNENFSDLIPLVRISARRLLDISLTDDNGNRLGIFSCEDKNTKERLKNFFSKLLNGVFTLERGLYYFNCGEAVNIPESLRNFSELVNFLSRIFYFDSQTFNPKDYEIEGFCFIYLPHNENIHGREILSAFEYDGKIPAILELNIKDEKRSEILTFRFFPIRYSHYPHHSQLDGEVPTAEVKRNLIEKCRDGREFEKIEEIFEAGRESLVEPYLEIELKDKDGNLISVIRGEVIKRGVKFYLVLYCKSYPDLTTQIEIGVDSKNKGIDPQDKLLRLAKDFLRLKLK